MMSLPFDSCYAIISFQPEVGTIIMWLVVSRVFSLEYKKVYVVVSEKMCGPIIEVAVMAVKEEDLGVHLARSTGPTEDTHCLHPAIPVHISRRCVVN